MSSEAGRYRKKSVVIEARQWDGTANGARTIIDWVLGEGGTARYQCSDPDRCAKQDGDCPHFIAIDTLEGPITASIGAWIIRGVKGEFYPCQPEIFAKTYEPADQPEQHPQGEERREAFRVAGDRDGRTHWIGPGAPLAREEALRIADTGSFPGFTNVRAQRRTITTATTPWEDMPDGD